MSNVAGHSMLQTYSHDQDNGCIDYVSSKNSSKGHHNHKWLSRRMFLIINFERMVKTPWQQRRPLSKSKDGIALFVYERRGSTVYTSSSISCMWICDVASVI